MSARLVMLGVDRSVGPADFPVGEELRAADAQLLAEIKLLDGEPHSARHLVFLVKLGALLRGLADRADRNECDAIVGGVR